MAITPSAKYPGQIDTSDPAGYPLGKAQNVSAPSAGDGTPQDLAWMNDLFGMWQALLVASTNLPSGNADKVGASQYFQSMRKLFGAAVASVSGLRALDSSEFLDGTLVAVVLPREFAFYEVTTGTVTDDGIRSIVFADDANRYASRVNAGYTFVWAGSISPLGGIDQGRFLNPGGGYSSSPPVASEYRFPANARLRGVKITNSGARDISGIAFYADPSPTTATPATLAHQLTSKVDVSAGETRFAPVIEGAPDMASAMAIAFVARRFDGGSTLVLEFVFELVSDDGGSSASVEDRRGDDLAPVEAAGVVDLITRVADNDPAVPREKFDITGAHQVVNKPLKIGGERNLHRFTESPGNATWFNVVSASASVDTADTILVDVDGVPVRLTRILDTSADTLLRSIYLGSGYTPLLAGRRYLMSCYVMNATEGVARFWMRAPIVSATAEPGHGQKVATSQPRRVWSVVQEAGGDATVSNGEDPTATYSFGNAIDPQWFSAVLGALTGDLADVYVGGFQIELLDTDDYDVDGICMVGDETMAGVDAYPAFSVAIRAAGNPDDVRSVQASRWIETEMNCRVFNRAIEGNTLVDIDTDWATDITPIATTGGQARYVIIQGGANDMVARFDAGDSGATVLATLKSRIATLAGNASTDGLIPVFLTVSPHPGLYGARNTTRQAYNAWLQSEYPAVIDINRVLESSDGQSIVRQPGYTPDGFNLDVASKEAVGKFIARQPIWGMPRPTQYQAAANAAPDFRLTMVFNGVEFYTGSGSPEGAVAAPPSSVYYNEAPTSAADAEYVKITGAGTTGWQAK